MRFLIMPPRGGYGSSQREDSMPSLKYTLILLWMVLVRTSVSFSTRPRPFRAPLVTSRQHKDHGQLLPFRFSNGGDSSIYPILAVNELHHVDATALKNDNDLTHLDCTVGMDTKAMVKFQASALQGWKMKATPEDFIVIELPLMEGKFIDADDKYSTEVVASKTLKEVLRRWNKSLLQSAQEKLAPSNMWYFPMLEKLAASENAGTIGGKEEDNNEDQLRTLILAAESLADLLGPIETRKALEWMIGATTQLENHVPSKQITGIRLKLFPNMLKEDRRRVHDLVRERFGFVESQTQFSGVLDNPQFLNLSVRKRRKRNSSLVGPRSWPATRPPHLSFSLLKAGKGTIDAIHEISRLSGIGENRFSYAGLKDAFGITSQEVRAWKVDPEQLKDVNKKLQNAGIGVLTTGLKYIWGSSMYLGGLKLSTKMKGNRFILRLRKRIVDDMTQPDPSSQSLALVQLEKAVLRLKRRGFINYFGPQRFGVGRQQSVRTWRTGLSILQGRWALVVDQIIFGMKNCPSILEAKRLWLENKDPTGALKHIPSYSIYRFHRKMLESLRDSIDGPTTKSRSEALVDPVTYVLAICEIPSNLMRLYVSSYQSLLWNTCASDRAAMNVGKSNSAITNPIVGDLVLLNNRTNKPLTAWSTVTRSGNSVEEYMAGIENDEEPLTQDEEHENFGKEEMGRTTPTVTKKDDHKFRSRYGDFRVHVVSQEDVECKRFRGEHIVLPLPGRNIIYPPYSAGIRMLKRMELDGLTEIFGGNGTINSRAGHKALFGAESLPGAYRFLVVKPKDLLVQGIGPENEFPDSEQALMDIFKHKRLKKERDDLSVQLQVNFSLPPSSYATTLMSYVGDFNLFHTISEIGN